MRRRAMSDREAIRSIIPRSSKDRRSLVRIALFVVVAILAVNLLLYLKRVEAERRAALWTSATATIQDARPKLIGQGNSQGGGAMLYNVEVLARFSKDGVLQQRWITVGESPMLLADAQFKAFRWKGQQCTVRWKPSDPDRVIAEAS